MNINKPYSTIMLPVRVIGAILLIISMILAVIWFGWKLCIVILLALIGNNIEMSSLKNKI